MGKRFQLLTRSCARPSKRTMRLIRCIVISLFLLSPDGVYAADETHRLHFEVNDEQENPLPCRIHLFDQQGRAQRADGQPFWRHHFVCDGRVTLDLEPGKYRYAVERGPEYEQASETLTLGPDGDHKVAISLHRLAELRKRGWYCADLHVHRPVSEMEQLMTAEDLDFAPVITWWNNRNLWSDRSIPQNLLKKFDGHRLYHVMAGEDEREGGALMYFGMSSPLDITKASREVPSPLQFVAQARQRNPDVWIDIEKPFWWDVPVWLASGQAQSIGIANNHMCWAEMLPNEAWGKPRDAQRLPDPLGNGYWTQEIYYHILNSGLRLPPSAGSASGVLPNPVGYNRVYVHLEKPFTRDAWWEGLRNGCCFVTNGPLLLCNANGQLPGNVLTAPAGDTLDVKIAVELIRRDTVKHLEVIRNGKVVHTLACDDKPTQQLTTKLSFSEPGWFLIRAIAENDQTFRFASTGPFYVEIGRDNHHISRTSVEFFQQWVDQRIKRVEDNVSESQQAAEVLKYHESAREFWQQRFEMANAN